MKRLPTTPTELPYEPLRYIRHLGMHVLAETGEGAVASARLEHREDLLNRAGFIQGGVLVTLMDLAGGVAAARLAETEFVATADMATHFVAPAIEGPFVAHAYLIRAGRRQVVLRIEVIDEGADRIVTTSTATFVRLERP